MSPLRTIVVPLDGSITSERALHPAHALARAAGATVRLLTVLPVTLWTDRIDEAERYLNKHIADEGFERFEISVITEQEAASAVADAASDPDTMVCMSTHGRGGLTQTLLGSTAEEVVRRSTRPILLVGPNCSPRWTVASGDNLVVAVDGSESSAEMATPAFGLARGLGLRAYAVQAVGVGADAVSELGYLRELADSAGVVDGAQWEVLHGDSPADAVTDYARVLPGAIVAVATHGRTGLARVTVGSVATQILRKSPCPVLMVRPSSLPLHGTVDLAG